MAAVCGRTLTATTTTTTTTGLYSKFDIIPHSTYRIIVAITHIRNLMHRIVNFASAVVPAHRRNDKNAKCHPFILFYFFHFRFVLPPVFETVLHYAESFQETNTAHIFLMGRTRQFSKPLVSGRWLLLIVYLFQLFHFNACLKSLHSFEMSKDKSK